MAESIIGSRTGLGEGGKVLLAVEKHVLMGISHHSWDNSMLQSSEKREGHRPGLETLPCNTELGQRGHSAALGAPGQIFRKCPNIAYPTGHSQHPIAHLM